MSKLCNCGGEQTKGTFKSFKSKYNFKYRPKKGAMEIRGAYHIKNQPGGNLVYKHKSIKFDEWENEPPQSISKSAEEAKKS